MKNPLKQDFLQNKKFTCNTKYLQNDDVFISINGGFKYLDEETLKKASCIILDEHDDFEGHGKIIKCSKLNDNYLQWLDELFSIDHSQFNNFFVTGTNGKTTTTHFLSDILSANNIDHGSVGTLGTFINNELVFQNQLTTEEPTYIRSFLDVCNKKNIDKVLFEASSIGIDQGRLDGMPIKHAVYLNLSRDHLDYHRNYESYLQAKRRLIENEELETLVFNADQPEFIDSLSNSNAKDVFQISNRNKSADIFYEIKNCDLTGNMKFIARTPWGEFDAEAKILTEYNIFNLLASLPYFYSVGGDVPSFFQSLSSLSLPEGRLQKINERPIYIDYAHTPHALEQACKSLKNHENKLILVFGAGGDRDTGKRKQMGEVADKYADEIIVTSDNPRNEDPAKIADMIIDGISNESKIHIELDRSKAISRAIDKMDGTSTLLVCGKGHEKNQIIGNNKFFFFRQRGNHQMYKLNGFRDLEQIAKFLGSSATNNMVINEVVFDSRQAKKNSLFIPLKGEQFDGEEFVQDCLNRGAACLSMNSHEGAVIQVPNVYTALLKLAQQKLENLSPVTFFITGSYGKTTIKDMLKFFIGADCHATSSNENNEFGIPFTILSMPESAKFLVVECGARKQWDFEEISSILKCDVFILTGIAGNHLETFGSIKEIENTKLQLRHSLRNQANFIDGRIIQETNYERFNKLLVEQALSLINLEKEIHNDDFVPSSGRGNEIQLYEGKIIDHTYNASPHTMVSTASKYDPKETILILGDMAELGDTEDKLHLSTLNELKEYQIFVTGNIFKKVFSKADSKQLTYFQGITDFPKDIFVKLLKEGKNLYFKGSRSSKMENYIEALIND